MKPVILLKQNMEIGVRSFFQSIDTPAPTVPLKKSVFNPGPGRNTGLEGKKVPRKAYARKHRAGPGDRLQSFCSQNQKLPVCFTLVECVISSRAKNHQWHKASGQGQAG